MGGSGVCRWRDVVSYLFAIWAVLVCRPDALEVEDDMRCNYDRYRIIVQNDCAGISEETALRQIDVDERYGDISKNTDQEDKKK